MLSNDFKPYLIRAFYEYLQDKGFTPYIHVFVNDKTKVPMQFVKDNSIVFSISMDACPDLQIKNEYIHFHARFSGKVNEIYIPIGHVMACYAKEDPSLMINFQLEIYEGDILFDLAEPVAGNKTKIVKNDKSSLSSHLKVVDKKQK